MISLLTDIGGLLCLLCCSIAGARVVLEVMDPDTAERILARIGGNATYWMLISDSTLCAGLAATRLHALTGDTKFALTGLIYLLMAIAANRLQDHPATTRTA